MKNEPYRSIVLIIAVVLISTFITYLPFVTNSFQKIGFTTQTTGFNTVYQNYDGVLYIVPAKTWYNPQAIEQLRLEFGLPNEYYPAHLPGYPFFIALLAPIFDYLPAMIVTTIFFTIFSALIFYFLVRTFNLTKHPLILTCVFLFLPRLLVLRTVGAPETLLLATIFGSLYFFEKKEYLRAGIIGAIAAATKTPGIILFAAYALVFLEKYIKHKEFSLKSLYILLIPVGLLSVFSFYQAQTGNFFAYFNTGGVVPMPYPFSVFNSEAKWVGTAWLEDILLYFFIYGLTIINLKDSKYRSFFYFPMTFFILSLFVQHRDLSRYMIPLWPFTLIAFERLFTSKRFLILALILLPAIYLYAWNFMLSNVLPISDWRPFL